MNSSEILVKRKGFGTATKITQQDKENGIQEVMGLRGYRDLTKEEKESNIQSYLSNFESDGWRLIAATQSQNSGTYTFIFRRAKKDE